MIFLPVRLRRTLLATLGIHAVLAALTTSTRGQDANPDQQVPLVIVPRFVSKNAYKLLKVEEVRKELMLSSEQISNIKDAFSRFAAKEDELDSHPGNWKLVRLRAPDDASPMPPVSSYIRDRDANERTIEKVFSRLLIKAQADRLDQLDLRRDGATAILFDNRVAAKLNLQEDQQLLLRDFGQMYTRTNGRVANEAGAARRNLPNGPDRDQKLKKIQENESKQFQQHHQVFQSNMAKMLTKKQRDRFNKMLGDDFDRSKLQITASFHGWTTEPQNSATRPDQDQ